MADNVGEVRTAVIEGIAVLFDFQAYDDYQIGDDPGEIDETEGGMALAEYKGSG